MPERQRERERRKTKGYTSKTMAVRVHFQFWCSAKQREMAKLCVIGERKMLGGIFTHLFEIER